MKIKVLVFGQLSDITGDNILELSDIRDTDQLIFKLNNLFPALKNVRYACAVDQKVISSNTRLSDDCTVALLPPFSGG
jgi:molybdopterin converting factor small subunit